FGIDKNVWVQDVQNRVFSTLGQPNWLAAYLNILLMIVLGKIAIHCSSTYLFIHLSNYLLLFVFYLCLLFTKSRSGFLGFTGGAFIFASSLFLTTSRKKRKKVFSLFLIPGLIILTLSLIVGTPFSSVVKEQGLGITSLDQPNITPSSQIRKIVWQGALDLWKKYPVLGMGVETFAYSYYWVRPAEHNLTSEWDFLYNKAHNEYLNLAATTGSFGLISYLLIPAVYFIWIIKKFRIIHSSTHPLIPSSIYLISFLSALISILITNFFGFSVVVVGLWFFLLPALATLLFKTKEKEKKEKETNFYQTLGLAGVGILTLFFVYQIYAYWQADYYLAKGLNSEQKGFYEESLGFLQKAVALRNREALYYDKLSLTLASLAWVADKQGNNQEAEMIIGQAVEASDQALKLSPYQLNYYRDRAKMFFVLSQINLDYLEESLAAMMAAIKLAPTDAKLYYNAGLMFASLGKKEAGQEYLKKALELKPNYDQVQQFLKDN
ncbi:O-antigen ligase family protein, partial [Candidatus Shapirobacteria bacterium]|nr:O-antigen ligase family protein [Candidatus Shapirobacteria bacterium]